VWEWGKANGTQWGEPCCVSCVCVGVGIEISQSVVRYCSAGEGVESGSGKGHV
jgi:hypothetical protein